jgi:hypothetical protein
MGQIELHKITHRIHVIKSLLCRRIGQAIPLLKLINAQHHRRGICGRSLCGLEQFGAYQSRQTHPMHHPLHLNKKTCVRTPLLMRLLKRWKSLLIQFQTLTPVLDNL